MGMLAYKMKQICQSLVKHILSLFSKRGKKCMHNQGETYWELWYFVAYKGGNHSAWCSFRCCCEQLCEWCHVHQDPLWHSTAFICYTLKNGWQRWCLVWQFECILTLEIVWKMHDSEIQKWNVCCLEIIQDSSNKTHLYLGWSSYIWRGASDAFKGREIIPFSVQ